MEKQAIKISPYSDSSKKYIRDYNSSDDESQNNETAKFTSYLDDVKNNMNTSGFELNENIKNSSTDNHVGISTYDSYMDDSNTSINIDNENKRKSTNLDSEKNREKEIKNYRKNNGSNLSENEDGDKEYLNLNEQDYEPIISTSYYQKYRDSYNKIRITLECEFIRIQLNKIDNKKILNLKKMFGIFPSIQEEPNIILDIQKKPKNKPSIQEEPNHISGIQEKPNNKSSIQEEPNDKLTIEEESNDKLVIKDEPNKIQDIQEEPSNFERYKNGDYEDETREDKKYPIYDHHELLIIKDTNIDINREGLEDLINKKIFIDKIENFNVDSYDDINFDEESLSIKNDDLIKILLDIKNEFIYETKKNQFKDAKECELFEKFLLIDCEKIENKQLLIHRDHKFNYENLNFKKLIEIDSNLFKLDYMNKSISNNFDNIYDNVKSIFKTKKFNKFEKDEKENDYDKTHDYSHNNNIRIRSKSYKNKFSFNFQEEKISFNKLRLNKFKEKYKKLENSLLNNESFEILKKNKSLIILDDSNEGIMTNINIIIFSKKQKKKFAYSNLLNPEKFKYRKKESDTNNVLLKENFRFKLENLMKKNIIDSFNIVQNYNKNVKVLKSNQDKIDSNEVLAFLSQFVMQDKNNNISKIFQFQKNLKNLLNDSLFQLKYRIFTDNNFEIKNFNELILKLNIHSYLHDITKLFKKKSEKIVIRDGPVIEIQENRITEGKGFIYFKNMNDDDKNRLGLIRENIMSSEEKLTNSISREKKLEYRNLLQIKKNILSIHSNTNYSSKSEFNLDNFEENLHLIYKKKEDFNVLNDSNFFISNLNQDHLSFIKSFYSLKHLKNLQSHRHFISKNDVLNFDIKTIIGNKSRMDYKEINKKFSDYWEILEKNEKLKRLEKKLPDVFIVRQNLISVSVKILLIKINNDNKKFPKKIRFNKKSTNISIENVNQLENIPKKLNEFEDENIKEVLSQHFFFLKLDLLSKNLKKSKEEVNEKIFSFLLNKNDKLKNEMSNKFLCKRNFIMENIEQSKLNQNFINFPKSKKFLEKNKIDYGDYYLILKTKIFEHFKNEFSKKFFITFENFLNCHYNHTGISKKKIKLNFKINKFNNCDLLKDIKTIKKNRLKTIDYNECIVENKNKIIHREFYKIENSDKLNGILKKVKKYPEINKYILRKIFKIPQVFKQESESINMDLLKRKTNYIIKDEIENVNIYYKSPIIDKGLLEKKENFFQKTQRENHLKKLCMESNKNIISKILSIHKVKLNRSFLNDKELKILYLKKEKYTTEKLKKIIIENHKDISYLKKQLKDLNFISFEIGYFEFINFLLNSLPNSPSFKNQIEYLQNEKSITKTELNKSLGNLFKILHSHENEKEMNFDNIKKYVNEGEFFIQQKEKGLVSILEFIGTTLKKFLKIKELEEKDFFFMREIKKLENSLMNKLIEKEETIKKIKRQTNFNFNFSEIRKKYDYFIENYKISFDILLKHIDKYKDILNEIQIKEKCLKYIAEINGYFTSNINTIQTDHNSEINDIYNKYKISLDDSTEFDRYVLDIHKLIASSIFPKPIKKSEIKSSNLREKNEFKITDKALLIQIEKDLDNKILKKEMIRKTIINKKSSYENEKHTAKISKSGFENKQIESDNNFAKNLEKLLISLLLFVFILFCRRIYLKFQ